MLQLACRMWSARPEKPQALKPPRPPALHTTRHTTSSTSHPEPCHQCNVPAFDHISEVVLLVGAKFQAPYT